LTIFISALNKSHIDTELPSKKDQSAMLLWSKILGGAGIFMIIAAIIVVALGTSTEWSAYLNDIGFQAFIFFGVLVGCNGIWLYSNSKDNKQDVKALPIDLKLFSTTRGYTWGTVGISLITFILYALLW
jgi:SSS family solute:Na+ symporter